MKAFREFLFSLASKVLIILNIVFLMGILVIMKKGNQEIAVLAAELGVEETIPIQKERISVRESVNRYIDTLPIPEETILEETQQQMEEESEIQTKEEQQEVIQEEVREEAKPKESVEVIVDENNELAQRVEGITPTIRTMNVSAYCPCVTCCGKDDGITANETPAKQWYTVASGERYAMGTIIYIPSLSDKPNQGWFVVEDRGGAIKNDKLDIYFESHQVAWDFGRHDLECYIYEF